MDENEDIVISTPVPRESIPMRTLEQTMHIRALLVAVLYTETELLAHLTGKNFQTLIDGKLEMVNDYVTDFVHQLDEASKITLLDDDGSE